MQHVCQYLSLYRLADFAGRVAAAGDAARDGHCHHHERHDGQIPAHNFDTDKPVCGAMKKLHRHLVHQRRRIYDLHCLPWNTFVC